ncbi:tetratricopeptide repeat protein [Clostridium beijerinckii]|uniref:tetratricopeptide repeat protein n=1 Tax=Clostridium beijerinckii TaxID=1520 RepID=UPI001570E874|nr:tetratricopeptide repeat protein [Clostridium beijerinckii]NRT73614.1 tetratricopeptide (TPR) repeat protein [Clostridium beijerinckii]
MSKKVLFRMLVFIFILTNVFVPLAKADDNIDLKSINERISQLEDDNKSLKEEINKLDKQTLSEYYEKQNDNIMKNANTTMTNIYYIIVAVGLAITFFTAVGTIVAPLIISKKEEKRLNELKDMIDKLKENLSKKEEEYDRVINSKGNEYGELVRKMNLIEQKLDTYERNAKKSADEAKDSEKMSKFFNLVNQALTLIDDKKYKEAILKLNKAIELSSQDAEAYYNRGFAYEGLGELDLALKDYKTARKLYTDEESSYMTLNAIANIHRKMGNISLAEKEIASAIEIKNDEPYTLGTCAEIALQKDDKEAFYHYIAKALENGLPTKVFCEDDIYMKVNNEIEFQKLIEKYKYN